LANRESALAAVLDRTQAVFIPPYNHEDVIEGQATCAMEIIEDLRDLDFILAPVGGGGLLSGTALAAHYFSPQAKVIGTEPAEADDAYQSFKQGQWVPLKSTQTIADGLKTSLGNLTFEYIKNYVHDIGLVSEVEIKSAWKHAFEYEKLLIEPSFAVPLAYLLKNKTFFNNKKTAIILTGGNVDVDFFIKTLYPIK
jgi:threonine dehydratase